MAVCEDLRMMLLGHCGVGKSATANVILGTETFPETETIQCELQRGTVDGRSISVIDTPGINNTSLTTEQWRSELKKALMLSSPGPHVFLLVTKVGEFSEEERNAVKWIRENFGEEAQRFTMILFTGREEMTNRQWENFTEDARMKDLISSCGGRYCGINSKREANATQVRKMLEDIEGFVQQNGDQVYTEEMYEAADRMRTTDMTQKTEKMRTGHESKPKPNQDTHLEVRKEVIEVPVQCGTVMPPKEEENSVKILHERKGEMEAKFGKEAFRRQEETHRERKIWEEERGATEGLTPAPAMDLRIVLLGKTGSGKSATGNTFLKGKYFKVESSPVLVTTKSEVKTSGNIRVIDTPGLFNTLLTPDELLKEMDQCISVSTPGPHVFLLVVKLGRVSEEEKNTVKWLMENFGKHALSFTIVLFTHTDQLGERTLDDFLAVSPDLRHLLKCCGNRYHAFNNNDSNPSQVENLMQKIDNMVMMNEGCYYTNEMHCSQGNVRTEDKFVLGLAAVAGLGALALAALEFLSKQ